MKRKEILNRLVIDNGIFLDDKKIEGVREYSVNHNEEDNLATLTLKMDVTILRKCRTDNDVNKAVMEYSRNKDNLQCIP